MITTWESPIPRMDARRLSFIYIDEARLSQRDGAFSVQDKTGTFEIPVGSIAALMIGPGVTLTSKAVHLAATMGVKIIWTGQDGVRFYASGGSYNYRSTLIAKQAKLVSNVHSRSDVARKMYAMRFKTDEDLSQYTIAQLRGKEGSRVKDIYRKNAEQFGVEWSYRKAQVQEGNSPVNLALTMSTQCLYGVVHSVIEAIGASPALGFIHTGHVSSFVFDIADLYKMDIVVPVAFELASSYSTNIELESRMKMREVIHAEKLPKRIVSDIQTLLILTDEDLISKDEVSLWDDVSGEVPANSSWSEK